ncbi:hypothetical protein TH1_11030 [Thalassospira lucentensis MCCC 1A00383 = DSM 14000]|nr:hypothetical protein TH1_11030 [Thalassospira lucentensis MCCC 1A00383 = DSM 14000]
MFLRLNRSVIENSDPKAIRVASVRDGFSRREAGAGGTEMQNDAKRNGAFWRGPRSLTDAESRMAK